MTFIAESTERLDHFLVRHLPGQSRSRIVRHIEDGRVLVEGRARKPGFPLRPGYKVEVESVKELPAHDLTPYAAPLDVVYEDDDLLVVDKPRGMPTHPTPSNREVTLVNALLARTHALSNEAGSYRPGIVHRLDKETTGLLVVAKTNAAHRSLAEQIQRKTAERRYVAVVANDLEHERIKIDAPIGRDPKHRTKKAISPDGRSAVTYVKRLRRVNEGTLIAVRLETGRTHQIRVHCAACGHPVLGDPIYAPNELRGWPMQLHAAYLGFEHPAQARRIEVYTPPPPDFLYADLVTRGSLSDW